MARQYKIRIGDKIRQKAAEAACVGANKQLAEYLIAITECNIIFGDENCVLNLDKAVEAVGRMSAANLSEFLEDHTYVLKQPRGEKKELLSGSASFIKIVYNNMIGRNFDDESEYVKYMAWATKELGIGAIDTDEIFIEIR